MKKIITILLLGVSLLTQAQLIGVDTLVINTDTTRILYQRRNFAYPKPTDLSSETGLVAAYNMIPSNGGVLTDISGNGNNISLSVNLTQTIEGISSQDKICAGALTTPVILSRNSASLCFRVKINSLNLSGAYINNNYVTYYNTKAARDVYFKSNGLFIIEDNTNNDFWSSVPSPYYVNIGSWNTIVVNADSGTVKTYMNGILVDTQTPIDDLTIRYLYGAYTSELEVYSDLEISDFRIYNRPLSESEIQAYHNQFANQVYFRETFADQGVGETNPYGWIQGTGSYEVKEHTSDDAVLDIKAGDKYLECTSDGTIAIQSNQSYGIWEFNVVTNGVGLVDIDFINQEKTAQNNCFSFQFRSDQSIRFRKFVSGIATTLFNTDIGFIDINTIYEIKITRSFDGEFTVYIKGGTFGDTYTLVNVTGGSGTNPVTDNTYTTSNYTVLDFDSGDQVGNIIYKKGIEQ